MSLPDALVILSPAFPKNETETNWLPAQQLLVKELRKQVPGTRIIILSFLYPYEKMHYTWNGAEVFAYGGMRKRKLKHILVWMRIWQKLKSLRKANNIIGLLSFWCSECALIGSYFGKIYGIKHYCWICGQDARKKNKMVRWIRPSSEELVGISHSVIDEFHRSHGIRPAHFIPIAIDTKMFPQTLPSERTIDVMAAGNLTVLKQYDFFVHIVNALQKKLPQLTAVHCGDGEEKENIARLIKELGLEERIEMKGVVPHPRLLPLMQHAKVFLHPSAYEGFGAVCMEALYAGAHVISFCRPINASIPNWHIVNTVEEMTDKAFEILTDLHLKHEPVPLFSIDRTANEIMQLFRN